MKTSICLMVLAVWAAVGTAEPEPATDAGQDTTKTPVIVPRYLSKDDARNFKIPSTRFCKEMELKPHDRYFILPWWFHACQGMLERRHKKIQHSYFTNIPVYGKLLNHLQDIKRQVPQGSFKASIGAEPRKRRL